MKELYPDLFLCSGSILNGGFLSIISLPKTDHYNFDRYPYSV